MRISVEQTLLNRVNAEYFNQVEHVLFDDISKMEGVVILEVTRGVPITVNYDKELNKFMLCRWFVAERKNRWDDSTVFGVADHIDSVSAYKLANKVDRSVMIALIRTAV